jgi:hypothetical protein
MEQFRAEVNLRRKVVRPAGLEPATSSFGKAVNLSNSLYSSMFLIG